MNTTSGRVVRGNFHERCIGMSTKRAAMNRIGLIKTATKAKTKITGSITSRRTAIGGTHILPHTPFAAPRPDATPAPDGLTSDFWLLTTGIVV